jgi:hypothetical protein
MKKLKIYYSILLLMFISIGCNDKFDITTFNAQKGGGNIGGDTVYIKMTPEWTGFNKPQDILVGNEPFIYIADTDNDRIVMMNMAGQVLGTRTIKKPVALSQDYMLNLFVCCEEIVSNVNVSALVKLDLVKSGHKIETAPITRLLPVGVPTPGEQRVKYTGICCFYDNTLYVSRTGPNNTSIIDPDNSILIFKKYLVSGVKIDSLVGRVPLLDATGTGIPTARNISSITTLRKQNIDFLLTTSDPNVSFMTQALTYNPNSENPRYETKFSPFTCDLMSLGKFKKPEGCTIDYYGNIFIADADSNRIYKFNQFGDELESFGNYTTLKNPSGVAWFDRVLYVADTGNNRILRFMLSTDLR